MIKTARFPLVGSLTNRNPNAAIADTKDQRIVNGFPQLDQNAVTGKPSVWLNKRQGTTVSTDVQAGATGSFGAVVWTANSAAVAPAIFSYTKTGSTSTMLFNSAGTQIGSDIAATKEILSLEETDVSGTGNLTAMITTTSNVLDAYFFAEGGAWTRITSAPVTSNTLTPAHAHMDGYFFIMFENGRLGNSDLNTVSSWTAGNYITANSYADNGVGCARYRNLIIGFGDYSAEFFYNAGNATGSVLSRIENATLRIGAIRNTLGRGTAIRSIGNNVYWIGVNADTGARGIYRLNGMQAEKVSGPAEDKMISNGAIRSIVGSFNLLGMTHIAFGGGTTTLLCFCPDTRAWWYFTPGGSLNVSALLAASDSSAISKSYFVTQSNAKVFTFDPSAPVWRDAGTSYSLQVQTENLDFGTRHKKIYKSAAIIGDEGTSTYLLSFSDDDWATTNTPLSTTANSKVTRLGASRRRSWIWTHSDNSPARVREMEVEYEKGIS